LVNFLFGFKRDIRMDHLALQNSIRHLRHKRKLTLAKVARLTGFTKSYLSMIERGKKSPPIATLSKIAQALSVDMSVFFQQGRIKNGLIIGRKKNRRSVVQDGSLFGYRYQAIASSGKPKRMEAFIASFPSNSKKTEFFDHEGEEFFYVLEGKIKFFYGDRTILMNEGDCIYFDSSVPHRGEASGTKTAKALAVMYTP
jgi:transcriptional regulator with XRE-family HTH domain